MTAVCSHSEVVWKVHSCLPHRHLGRHSPLATVACADPYLESVRCGALNKTDCCIYYRKQVGTTFKKCTFHVPGIPTVECQFGQVAPCASQVTFSSVPFATVRILAQYGLVANGTLEKTSPGVWTAMVFRGDSSTV
jgi:hypothetical protein